METEARFLVTGGDNGDHLSLVNPETIGKWLEMAHYSGVTPFDQIMYVGKGTLVLVPVTLGIIDTYDENDYRHTDYKIVARFGGSPGVILGKFTVMIDLRS